VGSEAFSKDKEKEKSTSKAKSKSKAKEKEKENEKRRAAATSERESETKSKSKNKSNSKRRAQSSSRSRDDESEAHSSIYERSLDESGLGSDDYYSTSESESDSHVHCDISREVDPSRAAKVEQSLWSLNFFDLNPVSPVLPKPHVSSSSVWGISKSSRSPNFERHRQGAVSASNLATSPFSQSSPVEQFKIEAAYPSLVHSPSTLDQLNRDDPTQDYWRWLSEQQRLRDENAIHENKKNLPLSLSQLASRSPLAPSLSSPLSSKKSLQETNPSSCSSQLYVKRYLQENRSSLPNHPALSEPMMARAPPGGYSIDQNRIKIDWNCPLTPKRESSPSIDPESTLGSETSSASAYSSDSSSYYHGVRNVMTAADIVLASVRLEMEERERQSRPSSPKGTMRSKGNVVQRTLEITEPSDASDSTPQSQRQTQTVTGDEDTQISANSEESPSLTLPSLKLLYDALEERVATIEGDVDHLQRSAEGRSTPTRAFNHSPSSSFSSPPSLSPQQNGTDSFQSFQADLSLRKKRAYSPSSSSLQSGNQSPGLPISLSEWYTEKHRRDQAPASSPAGSLLRDLL
jgi:hypothetical protein